MKLGPRRNYHKGRAAIRHYANQPLVGAFSVIIQLHRLIDLQHYSEEQHITNGGYAATVPRATVPSNADAERPPG